jgi:hypothetical protein
MQERDLSMGENTIKRLPLMNTQQRLENQEENNELDENTNF